MNPLEDVKVTSYQEPSAEKTSSTAVLNFLNQELRSQSDFSIEDEYPSLFRGLPGGESLFIEKEGKIVSHVGILIRQFAHLHFKMKIGLIGSVVTRKENRGEGFATYLIHEANRKLEQQGCTLSILWSDQPDFYLPLGFFRSGNEWDFHLSLEKAKNAPICCRTLNKERDLKAVWNLYQSRKAKLERTFEEMAALVDIPKTQIYVTENNGQIDSYIAINKGADFTHYIHEWCGSIDAVKRNILDCQNRFYPQTALTLISPFDNESSHFLDISERDWKGSLGLVKILNRKALIDCISSGKLATSYEELTDEELLLIALGRDGVRSPASLPLFLWGFDSI